MKWSNRVEIVEQTNNLLVVRETACYGAAFLFLTFGILIPVMMMSRPETKGWIVGAIASIWMLWLGIYSLLETNITVRRGKGLRVERSLLGIQRTSDYSLAQIQGIILRRTWRRGEGLGLQFTSGKVKNLTASLHFQRLGTEQLALEHSIRVFRRHHKSIPSAGTTVV